MDKNQAPPRPFSMMALNQSAQPQRTAA